jgi:hypothetical protein
MNDMYAPGGCEPAEQPEVVEHAGDAEHQRGKREIDRIATQPIRAGFDDAVVG